jgi:hypothetical protein
MGTAAPAAAAPAAAAARASAGTGHAEAATALVGALNLGAAALLARYGRHAGSGNEFLKDGAAGCAAKLEHGHGVYLPVPMVIPYELTMQDARFLHFSVGYAMMDLDSWMAFFGRYTESMYIRQLSVFLENRPGRLAAFTRLLGAHGIDMAALSLADTTHFGIVRCLVEDPDTAAKIIGDAGYNVRVTEVLGARVPDQPGGLAQVLETLAQEEIDVEYLYSFVRNAGRDAVLVFRVEALERAAQALAARGVELVGQEQLTAKA